MIRIDWINVAFVVIIVGGLLLIASTAQGAPRCPGGGQPDAQGRCMYAPAHPDSVCGWPFRQQPTNHRLAVCNRQAQVGQ